MDRLLRVALGGLQVVPFEGDTGQSEMRLRSKPLRWITHQLQHAPVGVGRERQLVVAFLYLAQTEHRRGRIDGISKRATTDGYDLGVGSAGVGPLPLDLMRISQRVRCRSPYGQVVRVQLFQGTTRLGDDDVCILLHDRQRGPKWRQ